MRNPATGWQEGCLNYKDEEEKMADLSKTEQKLIEKIAQELCRQMGEDSWETLPLERPVGKAGYLGLYKRHFYNLAKPILAIVKEALPELLKEPEPRGY